ncbi:Insulin-like growth factor 1 receptor [Aphelenchoides fujianensis]|nr:Insulin-like growth factor 1 receptor [Aphelenchoides fujianensis]
MFGVAKAPEQQGLYLVLELMNMGDLKTYVKQRQPQCDNYSQFPPALLPTELINIAQQVATGLCYIASQQIVHRDLAARNCLVSGETDVRVCSPAFRPPITVKISDFGMSRRLYSQAEYYKMGDKQTALPVRWLPPEALECGRFTPASDMWSFGITLSSSSPSAPCPTATCRTTRL